MGSEMCIRDSASFAGVGMRDCNLVRVHFDRDVSGVEFKSSNTNEALFGEEAG